MRVPRETLLYRVLTYRTINHSYMLNNVLSMFYPFPYTNCTVWDNYLIGMYVYNGKSGLITLCGKKSYIGNKWGSRCDKQDIINS